MAESDEFLTVAEVAAALKLNHQTVRNWIVAGKLPALHAGRRVRIRRADFDALIEGSAISQRPRASIWDGEIPLPVVPAGSG